MQQAEKEFDAELAFLADHPDHTTDIDTTDRQRWIMRRAQEMLSNDASTGYPRFSSKVYETSLQDPGYQRELRELNAKREAAKANAKAKANDPYVIEANRLYTRDEALISRDEALTPEEQRKRWIEGMAHLLRAQALQDAQKQAAEQRAKDEQRVAAEQAAVDKAKGIAKELAIQFKGNTNSISFPADTTVQTAVRAMEAAEAVAQRMQAHYPEQWERCGLDGNQALREQAVRATAATLIELKLNRTTTQLMEAAFAHQMLNMEIVAR